MPCRKILLLVVFLGMCSVAQAQSITELREALLSGDVTSAESIAETVRASAPSDPDFLLLEAELLWQRGDSEAALVRLKDLHRAYPNRPEPLNNQAVILARGGELGAARELLEQALNLQPGFSETFANLGDVYSALAARSYQQALGENAGTSRGPGFALSRRMLAPVECPASP